MKKIYMIIAQKGFRDEELMEPKILFEKEGYTVEVASPHGGECEGMLGLKTEANIRIKDIDVDDQTAAVLIIGGANSPSLMQESIIKDKIIAAKNRGLVIGAICLAPMVLAHLNIIDGRSATVYPTDDSLAKFKEHNVLYIDEDVVIDGELITANGPQSATEFGRSVLDVLREED